MQRENRALLAKYAKGKKVLNTFCYSGGFSIFALEAGAEVNAITPVGGSPLHFANRYGHQKLFDTLLKHWMKVNDTTGRTDIARALKFH